MNKIFNASKINIDNTEAKALFSSAFKEKAENTDRLFKTLLKDSLHLTLSVEQQIVSQLFLIESEIILDKTYPIYYLYAAATKHEYRGLGFMHLLIEYAKEITVKNNKYGIVLKPANNELFTFYASCGFNKVLYSNIYEYTLDNKMGISKKITANEYISIREKLLKDIPHIAITKRLITGIENHYYIFGDNDSITLAEKHTENGKAFIAEHIGNNNSLQYTLNQLNCKTATVKSVGDKTPFSVIWLSKIKEPQYNIYHGPCFE